MVGNWNQQPTTGNPRKVIGNGLLVIGDWWLKPTTNNQQPIANHENQRSGEGAGGAPGDVHQVELPVGDPELGDLQAGAEQGPKDEHSQNGE